MWPRIGDFAFLGALVMKITLTPEGDELEAVMEGDLAAMLAAADPGRRLVAQIKLVAGGACNRPDLARWWRPREHLASA